MPALLVARLTTIKTLSGFTFQPSLDRERIPALAELELHRYASGESRLVRRGLVPDV